MWKSLESKSAMMLLVPLIYWKYMYTLLLASVQPSHRATVSWDSSFTGSNESLCIHPRSIEVSVKTGMWDPCPSFWMVMYIGVSETRKSRRFNVSTP